MKSMLSELKKKGIGLASFYNPDRKLPLHAMISSCGFQQLRAGDDYYWDGLKRGDASFFLWQLTLSGHGRLCYEGKEYLQEPGTAMFLRIPHDHCYWLPEDSESWEFLYCCLYGSEIMRILQQLQKRAGFMIDFDDDSAFLKTVMSICVQAKNKRLQSPFDNSSAAYQFAMSLVKEKLPLHSSSERPGFIKKVEEFCRENIREPLSVDDLAEAAGYSRYHFSRQFTEYQGVSPALFLRNFRLQEAANLLNSKRLTVKEVAAECGFMDCSHFCRLFKESYGLTPESFRKSGMY